MRLRCIYDQDESSHDQGKNFLAKAYYFVPTWKQANVISINHLKKDFDLPVAKFMDVYHSSRVMERIVVCGS